MILSLYSVDFSECLHYSQVSKMSRADPNLLALLEKASNPLTFLPLTLKLRGVFAPPEQWKLTDEANPGLFTYTLEVLQMVLPGGKIEPRKLTEKELREQEEAKNKKASKKQTKEEEKPAEHDPDAERRRIEWEALSEQQKFHRSQEDPFKAFSLLWADSERREILEQAALEQFEGFVNAGSFEIVLTRRPEGTEEDMAKLKKSKPKTLNLGELYAAKYRGRVDVSGLAAPGATKLLKRVPLQFSGDVPAECIKIESDKCYALIEIDLQQALNPEVTEITPAPQELLGESPAQALKSSLLQRLSEQIRKGVRAVSQQYASFFSKEKDHSEEKKFSTSNNASLLNVSTLRINEINKRKELFLQEFVASGKYALLRDRIVRTVRAIIIDKCRKEKQGAAVTREALQKVLSELNVFFKDMLEKALDECLASDASMLHEDLILNHEYTRSTRRAALAGMAEAQEERETRLAGEYEAINRVEQAEEKFLNLVLLNRESTDSLEAYARFCLRHRKYEQAFALYSRINASAHEFRYRLILALFRIQRGREREAAQVLGELEREERHSTEEKIVIHQLLALVEERLGQEKASERHTALAEKYYQMKNNPAIRINPPRNPYLDPAPKVPKPGRYVSQLSQQESQEIRLSLMQYFVDYNFYGLARGYLGKLAEGERKEQLRALVLMGEEEFEGALEVVERLLEKSSRNMEYLMLKADICFKSDRIFECEEVFLYILNLRPAPPQAYSIYLRLALTYLNRKSWEDARLTFNKAVELRPNSAAGWMGLGIATLELGALRESEEAFNLSSIYNPLSRETEPFLGRISAAVDEQHRREYRYFQPESDS